MSDQPPNKIHWINTHKSYTFAYTSYSRIIIFMKQTFNKQIIVVYITLQYIESIILAIKHAKQSKLRIK